MLWKRETFAALSLVLASTGIFLLAFGIRTTWLPDIVPVADSEALQSVWGLEAAVLLKAVENIAGFRRCPCAHGLRGAADTTLDAVPDIAGLTSRPQSIGQYDDVEGAAVRILDDDDIERARH